MLIPMTAALAIQIAAVGPIGVAAASSERQICVAMPGSALSPGTSLTLIQTNATQSARVATVVRPLAACERLERAGIPGPYYLAQAPSSAASDSGNVWVALSGRLATRRIGSDAIVVELSATYPNAQVRVCTSHEGLHLTLWAGTPLTSQRLWHEYYYLGYDVEPSCDDRDVGAAR
jgi:hypothetical protein